MKSVLIVLLFLASVALAQQSGTPLYSWAGTTQGSPTWFQPDTSTPTGCVAESGTGNQSPYVVVNFTVTTTGVYQVLVMGDYSDFSPYAYVYSGAFVSTTPCANYVRELGNEQGQYDTEYGPQIFDFVTFTAGTTYFIVVTGSSSSYYGQFALNVNAPLATGSTNTHVYWNVPEFSSGGSCSDGSYNSSYVRIVWTPTTTGTYDITVGIDQNTTADFEYLYVLMYTGTVSDADIAGNTPCTPTVGTVLNGYYDDYRGAVIYGQALTAGQAYTLVFSGDEDTSIANYGVQVTPTRVRTFTTTPSWNEPDYGVTDCAPDTSNTAVPWTSWSFVATGYVVMVGVAQEDIDAYPYDTIDALSFLYAGDNSGSSLLSPSTCGGLGVTWYGGWDYEIPAINSIPNNTYTVVVGPYSSGATFDADTAVIIFILSGQWVGVFNASATTTATATTTTAAGTTTTTTTASGTTTTTASGTTTTTASGTTTTTATTTPTTTTTNNSTGLTITTTTSDMSTVAVSFVVLAVSFVALL